jgi:hypothetical protein
MQVGVDAKMRWTLVVCAILAVWISMAESETHSIGEGRRLHALMRAAQDCLDADGFPYARTCLSLMGLVEAPCTSPAPDPPNPVFDAESARRLEVLWEMWDPGRVKMMVDERNTNLIESKRAQKTEL